MEVQQSKSSQYMAAEEEELGGGGGGGGFERLLFQTASIFGLGCSVSYKDRLRV